MIGKPIKIIQFLYNEDKEKVFEIKEYKEKRSLNANNYCWKLITEIAEAMVPTLSKEEVYMRMLVDYGQSMLIPVEKGKKPDGYFKYYRYETSSILNGKEADWYKVYKGTSEYNTKEMSIFIDGVVQEAQQLGIDTRTPDEIERLKSLWNEEII